MKFKNLDERMKAAGGALKLLRDSQTGPNPYPVVKPEYSNWRDEQWAWQNAAVIFNQSYHMTDLYVYGPDAFKLLESLGINSFAGFVPGKAKQYVPVTWDGHVIGDVILCYLAKNKFNLIGRPPVANWVTYHAETGKQPRHRQEVAGEAGARRPLGRSQEPDRAQDLPLPGAGPERDEGHDEGAEEGAAGPEVLQHDRQFKIAGKKVEALRHGMAGQPGFELFGPAKDGDAVLDALVKAGEEFGLRLVGGRAYSSNTLESGWIPSPMPGIYSGDERMAKYRKWLDGE